MAQQQGMFGPTPEELQMMLMQQQQANNWKQGMDWGSRNLGQQISAGSFMGGQGIGQGLGQIGQALGVIPEDPRLTEARKLMEIRKSLMDAQIDPQDIDTFYPEMIKRLNAAGLTEQANKAMQQYTQAQTAQGNLEARRATQETQALTAAALAEQRRAEATKRESEQKALQGRVALVRRKQPELTEEEALGIASDTNAFKTLFETAKVKTQVVQANGRRLLINSDTGETIKDLGAAGKTLGEGLSDLGSGLAAAGAKKEAEAAGTGTAKEALDIQNRYDALDSLQQAKKVLSEGIYAGIYGPTQEAVSALTLGAVGDKKRLENTQRFRSYIGEVVIPRLKDFGGSDTVEELNYLRRVLAGETTLEPGAIKSILEAADKKIRARIKRIEEQQKSVRAGTQLPVGPMNTKTVRRTLPSGIVVEEVVEE